MLRRRVVRSVPAALLLVSPLAAQTPLLVVPGDKMTEAAPLGDWDGDGVGDILAGIPQPVIGAKGFVRILSGHDGAQLAQLTGTIPGQNFGQLVSGLGDADADGVVDLAVASFPWLSPDPPMVQVFSGATGAVLFAREFGPFELSDIAAVGDTNGDGFADLVTGGFGCPGGGLGTINPGRATLWSVATDSELHEWCGDGAGDHFGTQLAGGGDVDGDGHPDVIVGASENDDWSAEGLGYVRVFSGLDGHTLHTLEGPPTDSSGFAETLDSAGDVDGDGHADVLVGARQEKVDGVFHGAARVSSGADGSLLHHVVGPYVYEQFGFDVAGPGDVNGDGLADFAVATSHVQGSSDLPGYEVYSGPDAGLLQTVAVAPHPGDFGLQLAAGGDIQGDGIPDLLLLNWHTATLEVRSGAPLLFDDLGFALAGAAGVPELQVEGVLAKGLPLVLQVSGAAPLAPLFLVLGGSATPVPFKGGVLVPAPQLVLGGLATDAAGHFALEATVASALPAGLQIVLQGWLPDAGGPAGFAATNAVLGVAP